VERGLLDLDAPVARYWHEFAAAGKEELPVRWLLSHRAGLPAVDVPLTLEQACAWEPVIDALEAQAPLWRSGSYCAYHANTYGFLVGEVIRRVSGKTPGRFFAHEIAQPLGLSAWIGLPEEFEPRLARLEDASVAPLEHYRELLERWGHDRATSAALAGELYSFLVEDPTAIRASSLSGAFSGGVVNSFATRRARAAEFPAANLVTDARSLARMYAATIGQVDGTRLLQPATVAAMSVLDAEATSLFGLPASLTEIIGDLYAPTSLGFTRPCRATPLLGPNSFGHAGAGGQLGFADPDAEIAFGYVTNFMRIEPDERARGLAAAVAACAS
jgi:CubicO group peptidase (beta-lactamase class C family)